MGGGVPHLGDLIGEEMRAERARKQHEPDRIPATQPVPPLDPYEFEQIRLQLEELPKVVLSSFVESKLQDPSFEPKDLDKLLPKNPDLISDLINGNYPAAVRAKVVEVALLRGGTYPYSVLRAIENGAVPPDLKYTTFRQAGEMRAYQWMAIDIMDTPAGREVFRELSKSGDMVHDRRPATQLMHIALQEGGIRTRNDVEDFMRRLEPEDRGRGMYHLYDAAAKRDIAGGLKFDGAYGEVGVGPITLGASYKYENTHWQRTVDEIENKVHTELKQPDVDAYNNGMKQASKHPGGQVAP